MTAFSITLPGHVRFGRGEAAKAAPLIRAFGPRGLLVHGAEARRAAWLHEALLAEGAEVATLACPCEPSLPMLDAALARGLRPDWVVALGGGAAMDFGKALAALIPAPGGPMDHLEVVGKGLPLVAPPLPFIALPTTAGTGSEATRNAVIALPDHGRKVSIRDERMLPCLAIVDPALTDGCPRSVTLASGLDALTQVIEPYVSARATPFTDALTRPLIGPGLAALRRLMEGEEAAARDTMAWMSLTGGIALANAGLGAVHGLAGVIGGMFPAAHGAICGALLGPVLAVNRRAATGRARARIEEVCDIIAATLGAPAEAAPEALARWARAAGLPGLSAQGIDPVAYPAVAEAALASSSMRGNPVPLGPEALLEALTAAS